MRGWAGPEAARSQNAYAEVAELLHSQTGTHRARDDPFQEVTGTSWTNQRMDLKSTEKPQRRFKMNKIKSLLAVAVKRGAEGPKG